MQIGEIVPDVPAEFQEAIDARESLELTEDHFVLTGTKRQGRPEYRLTRSVKYREVIVPEGFVFDIHSLPRLLRPWQPKNPKWWLPPLLHDWMLESGLYAVEECNDIYLAAMREIDVKPHHRLAAFSGVEFARRFFPDRITRVDPDNIELVRKYGKLNS